MSLASTWISMSLALANDMEIQVIQVLTNNIEIQVYYYTPIDYECQLNIIFFNYTPND
jgi:hypothetical protein